MIKKKVYIFEIVGVVFSVVATVLLWNLYSLGNKGVVFAMISKVNNSLWEYTKPLLIVYVFYSLLGLAVLKINFRQFVVAKFIGVYLVLLINLSLLSLVDPNQNNILVFLIMVLSFVVGFIVSCNLTLSQIPLNNFFPTACFMLLLLFVIVVSFTAFPPQGKLFCDPHTGLYGIIPDYIDRGAAVLNELYGNL